MKLDVTQADEAQLRERTSARSDLSCEILTTNSEALDSIDRLFASATNATLFHHPKFLAYHAADKFPHAHWRHYLFSLNGKPVAFLPGAAVDGPEPTYRSPHASSFGGLVHGALSFSKLDQCLSIWWDDLQQQRVKRVEVVLAPVPYSEPTLSEAVEFKLNQLGFVLHEPELCLIAPIKPGPDFPRDMVRASAWRKHKQAAARGVTIRYSRNLDADLPTFYSILVENRRRFRARPTHSLEELVRIHSMLPNAVHLFLATVNSRSVAGILAFRATPSVVNAFYPADSDDGRESCAMDLLFIEMYKWAREQSIRWVDLGPSSFRLALHPTLTQFKERHGAEKFLRRRYLWHRSAETR
jgi:Acetyltransferase (GNAT) domain